MKYLYFTILSLAFMTNACSPKLNMQYQRTGLVNCVKHDKMTITVTSEAQAESIGKAAGFAERNAFENLLFKGIPKSNQEKPMISNEYKALDKNESFFRAFLVNRGFERYIMSSNIVNDFNSGGVKSVTQEIKIDLTNLRKHLENNGVIKSFGL